MEQVATRMILHDPTADFVIYSPSLCEFRKPQKTLNLCHLNIWNPTPLCTHVDTLSSSGTSLVCLKDGRNQQNLAICKQLWNHPNSRREWRIPKIYLWSHAALVTGCHQDCTLTRKKSLCSENCNWWRCFWTTGQHTRLYSITYSQSCQSNYVDYYNLSVWILSCELAPLLTRILELPGIIPTSSFDSSTLRVIPPNETPGLKGTQWSNTLQSGTTATHRLLFDGTPCRCINVPQGGIPIALLGDGRESVSLILGPWNRCHGVWLKIHQKFSTSLLYIIYILYTQWMFHSWISSGFFVPNCINSVGRLFFRGLLCSVLWFAYSTEIHVAPSQLLPARVTWLL